MISQIETLATLYEDDETAWLEEMARLIAEGRVEDLDLPNLAEFLGDMSRRDRREVKSCLTQLLVHLLKWQHQPDKRTGGWRTSIVTQRQELSDLASRGVLRTHAESVLQEAYANAIERATSETGLQKKTFPFECPYSIDELLVINVPE